MNAILTPGDAMITDIIANPDDDVLRLIYADWLEDHEQDARAEYIRLQIELAKPNSCRQPDLCVYSSMAPYRSRPDGQPFFCGESDCVARYDLRHRERLLWASEADAAMHASRPLWGLLLPEISGWSPNALHFSEAHLFDGMMVWFTRGFVSRVRLNWTRWTVIGNELVQHHPIERVELADWNPERIGLTNPLGEVWVYRRNFPDGNYPPKELYDAIHLMYDSREAAMACMSEACLAWARRVPT